VEHRLGNNCAVAKPSPTWLSAPFPPQSSSSVDRIAIASRSISEPRDGSAVVNNQAAASVLPHRSSSKVVRKRKFDGTGDCLERSAKSSKTCSEQSAPIVGQNRPRWPSSLVNQVASPTVASPTETQSTETTILDLDEDHQNFLDIAGDGPVEPPTLDPGHIFAPLKDPLVPYGLAAAAQEMDRDMNARDVELALESGFTGLDDDGLEDSQWVKMTSNPRFCCPFYASNPNANRECLQTQGLNNIFAVKRHVCRDHRIPYYCPTCFEVFDVSKAKDNHIRARNCPRRDLSRRPGVTEKQVKLVARVSKDLPESKQWFSIFRILFPRRREPPSPYLDGELESAVANLREFWGREGQRIVSEFVASKIPEFEDHRSYASIPDEERALAALHSSVITDMLRIVMDVHDGSTHQSGWMGIFSV